MHAYKIRLRPYSVCKKFGAWEQVHSCGHMHVHAPTSQQSFAQTGKSLREHLIKAGNKVSVGRTNIF